MFSLSYPLKMPHEEQDGSKASRKKNLTGSLPCWYLHLGLCIFQKGEKMHFSSLGVTKSVILLMTVLDD